MKNLLLAVAILSHSYVMAQSLPDSIQNFLNEISTDTAKVNWLLDRADGLRPAEAFPFLESAYYLAQRSGDENKLGHAAYRIGFHFSRHGDRDTAHYFLQEAETLARETKDSFLLGYALNRLGINYAWKIDYETQLDYYLKALELWKKLGNEVRVAYTYESLGIFHYKKENLKESKEYRLKAKEIYERIGDYYGLFGALGALVDTELLEIENTFFNMKPAIDARIREDSLKGKNYQAVRDSFKQVQLNAFRDAKSWDYIKKGLEAYQKLSEAQKNDREVMRDYAQFIGIISQSYLKMEDYAKSETYRDSANLIYEKLGNPTDLLYNKAFYLYTYQKSKNHEKGIPLALSVIDELKASGQEQMMFDIYLWTATLYKAAGDYKNAHKYLDLHWRKLYKKNQFEVAELQKELMIKHKTGELTEEISAQEQIIQQQQIIQWISIGGILLLAGFLLSLFRNYRNKQRLNKKLTKKNEENELLLKEIHHRVKNNLQVISSLLSLQSAHIEDPKVLNAVQESQNRVKSMGLIHQKLYQGENLAAVEMKDYLHTLSESMLDFFGGHAGNIDIQIKMDELELDVDTAIPIGLIINELVTNSIKYAFPNQQEGEIKISLGIDETKQLHLVVADNGIGTDENAESAIGSGSGFGSQLVNLLTMQLNGHMRQENREGLVTEMRFKQYKAA